MVQRQGAECALRSAAAPLSSLADVAGLPLRVPGANTNVFAATPRLKRGLKKGLAVKMIMKPLLCSMRAFGFQPRRCLRGSWRSRTRPCENRAALIMCIRTYLHRTCRHAYVYTRTVLHACAETNLHRQCL